MSRSSHSTYPPLNVLKPVAEDVWVVDSGPLRAFGVPLPLRMTVVRLESGGVWLHSPTQHSPTLQAAVEAIGPIQHLVAPSMAHWIFLKDWQNCCSSALTWVAPGVERRKQVRKSGLRVNHVLKAEAPPAWAGDINQLIVPGGADFNEVAFFHMKSRTLILADIVQNLEASKLPAVFRPIARLLGVVAPDGKAPIYLRALVKVRHAAASKAAKALVAFSPDRVIFSHGTCFEHDGTASLRRSLRWLL